MSENKGVPGLSARTVFLIVSVFFLAALAVRLAFWFEFRASDLRALLVLQSMDSLIFHEWAVRIAGGDLLVGDRLFTLSPFYSYLVAAIYALAGSDMFSAILVQLVLGAGGVVVIYFAGRILFSPFTGVAAAGLTAFYGHYILTEGLLLSEAFIPFLTALFILWTAWALKRQSPALFIVSGILLGMLFLTRPQYFLVVAVLPVFGFLGASLRDRRQRQGWRERKAMLKILAFGAAGAALMTAPLAIRNLSVTGRPVLVTPAGGVNFYIGNNPKAKGTWYVPKGFRTTQEGMLEDFAKAAGGGEYNDTHSRYWFSRGFKAIGEDFPGWVRLMLRKAALFWNNRETPLNFDYSFLKERLKSPGYAFIPFFVVGSLGLLGLFLAMREKKALWLVLAAAGYFGGTVLFFICARYRVALVPYLVLFAAYAVDRIVALIRRKDRGGLMRCGMILAPCIVLTLLAFPAKLHPSCKAHQIHQMGLHYLVEKNDTTRGGYWIGEALKIDPDNPVMWGDRGMILFSTGRLEEAEGCLRKALEGLPGNAVLWRNLGEILNRTGRPEEAREAFKRSAEPAGNRSP